jgi:hypothetical protein
MLSAFSNNRLQRLLSPLATLAGTLSRQWLCQAGSSTQCVR